MLFGRGQFDDQLAPRKMAGGSRGSPPRAPRDTFWPNPHVKIRSLECGAIAQNNSKTFAGASQRSAAGLVLQPRTLDLAVRQMPLPRHQVVFQLAIGFAAHGGQTQAQRETDYK